MVSLFFSTFMDPKLNILSYFINSSIFVFVLNLMPITKIKTRTVRARGSCLHSVVPKMVNLQYLIQIFVAELIMYIASICLGSGENVLSDLLFSFAKAEYLNGAVADLYSSS